MVAHRGGDGAGIEKENSLKAFRAAYELGYRWFETDVVPTRDGKLLAIHGRGYQRHPNADLPSRVRLQRLSYGEVEHKIKVGGEPAVLLTELLNSFTDSKFFLDPKTYKAASVLAEVLIERPDYISRVCVGSFLPFNTSRVYRRVLRGTGENLAVSILGPLRNCVLWLSVHLNWLLPVARSHISLAHSGSVHIPYKWILSHKGHKFLDLAHKLGVKVAVYTPNERQTIETCQDKGVDIIMSDKVGLLKQIAMEK